MSRVTDIIFPSDFGDGIYFYGYYKGLGSMLGKNPICPSDSGSDPPVYAEYYKLSGSSPQYDFSNATIWNTGNLPMSMLSNCETDSQSLIDDVHKFNPNATIELTTRGGGSEVETINNFKLGLETIKLMLGAIQPKVYIGSTLLYDGGESIEPIPIPITEIKFPSDWDYTESYISYKNTNQNIAFLYELATIPLDLGSDSVHVKKLATTTPISLDFSASELQDNDTYVGLPTFITNALETNNKEVYDYILNKYPTSKLQLTQYGEIPIPYTKIIFPSKFTEGDYLRFYWTTAQQSFLYNNFSMVNDYTMDFGGWKVANDVYDFTSATENFGYQPSLSDSTGIETSSSEWKDTLESKGFTVKLTQRKPVEEIPVTTIKFPNMWSDDYYILYYDSNYTRLYSLRKPPFVNGIYDTLYYTSITLNDGINLDFSKSSLIPSDSYQPILIFVNNESETNNEEVYNKIKELYPNAKLRLTTLPKTLEEDETLNLINNYEL